MPKEFKLPALGENIDSGDVVKVLVSAGDRIQKDQTVLELETDKAAIEVPSPFSGVVKAVHVQEGEKAKVGQLILTLETETEEEKEAEAAPAAEKEAPQAEKAAPEAEEVRAEEEAEKRPAGGEAPPERPRRAPAEAAPPKEAPAEPEEKTLVPAAPSVRRLARDIGVDITGVAGSGPGGRISEEDVKAHARSLLQDRGIRPAAAPPAAALPDFEKWGPVERKAMTGVRRATAGHVATAWSSIPHVTQCDKADITDLETLRKAYAKKAEAGGGKLTVTAILLKLAASALKVFPQLNASVDIAREEIVYKKYYHIGVAVDTDRGLLVPVIRDVDRKNILQLSAELNQAAEKARSRKTALEEMQGGTFTITNLGGIGGTYFTPIIHFPEAAILGVSRSALEPVFRSGQFEPRLMLPLSLSYDHRVIDGADAARFLRWLADALEHPFLIALEG
ncbi:MAG: 2-oxo acid dehydrogenase subunit E2 [Candidatus Tectomicrobia bacterium]|nr:2-oxo acid dehydrogenase subunit E2 [Candidatus Tectomicrobia bacterium]